MNAWDKWKKRPQKIWLRKAFFQVHLWSGIGLGLYVVLMSVTGSAIVFRRELTRSLAQEPRVTAAPGGRMSEDELRQVARRAYPDYRVTKVYIRKNPELAAEITLERRGDKIRRLFDPYTGTDLGDSLRSSFRFILWLVDLHDNLLLASTGRLINAAGAIFTLLAGLTGAVIWWPGMDSWRRSLSFRWKASPKGYSWTLHSSAGFWTLGFFLMWAFTGFYLSIPEKFNTIVDFLEPQQPPRGNLRFGDQVLFWLAQMHFGRFAGIPVKIVWTVLGLAPAVLFVTGTMIWWKRVLKRWLKQNVFDSPQVRDIRPARVETSVQARS